MALDSLGAETFLAPEVYEPVPRDAAWNGKPHPPACEACGLDPHWVSETIGDLWSEAGCIHVSLVNIAPCQKMCDDDDGGDGGGDVSGLLAFLALGLFPWEVGHLTV